MNKLETSRWPTSIGVDATNGLSLVDLRTITLADYTLLVAITVITLFIVLVPYMVLAGKARWFIQSPEH